MPENWDTYVVLDTETSGASSPSRNQILTIDATIVRRIKHEDGHPDFVLNPNKFHAKIKKQDWALIEKEALEITGIVLDENWLGEEEYQVLDNLVSWVKKETGGRGYKLLCGYNVIFDKRFLHFLFKRNPYDHKWTSAFSYRKCDVLELAQWAYILGFIELPENFKLETIAKHLGVWEKGAHDSAVDVTMTLEVMIRLNDIMRGRNAR